MRKYIYMALPQMPALSFGHKNTTPALDWAGVVRC